jgi:hypothetical protein
MNRPLIEFVSSVVETSTVRPCSAHFFIFIESPFKDIEAVDLSEKKNGEATGSIR